MKGYQESPKTPAIGQLRLNWAVSQLSFMEWHLVTCLTYKLVKFPTKNLMGPFALIWRDY